MYRVLMPVDDDPGRGLTQARTVSNLPYANEAVEVLLMHVFQDDDRIDPATDEGTPDDVESVRAVREYLHDRDVGVELLGDRNDPVEAILEQADEHDVDAIVIGGRKRSPAGKVLFGSVSHSVLMNTDIPVMLTGDAGGET